MSMIGSAFDRWGAAGAVFNACRVVAYLYVQHGTAKCFTCPHMFKCSISSVCFPSDGVAGMLEFARRPVDAYRAVYAPCRLQILSGSRP